MHRLCIPTDRLYLRELRAEDWETIHAYCSHPSVRKDILPNSSTMTGAQELVRAAAKQAAQSPRTVFVLGVVLASEDRLIGTCCLNRDVRNGSASIGWDLNYSYWGHGYMTEAARAVASLAFGRLGVAWICADCFMGNKASIRVMEKIGMRRHQLSFLDELRLARGYKVYRRIVRHCLSAANWEAFEGLRAQTR